MIKGLKIQTQISIKKDSKQHKEQLQPLLFSIDLPKGIKFLMHHQQKLTTVN